MNTLDEVIINHISETFLGYQLKDLCVNDNSHKISQSRHIISYVMRTMLFKDYAYISKILNRDRATIYYSIKVVSDFISMGDEYIIERVQEISKFLNDNTRTEAIALRDNTIYNLMLLGFTDTEISKLFKISKHIIRGIIKNKINK